MPTLNIRSIVERLRRSPSGGTLSIPGDASQPPSVAGIRRELATHAAGLMGAQRYVGQFGGGMGMSELSRTQRRDLRNRLETHTLPCLLIDPRAGLNIIDVNDAYAGATMIEHSRTVGRRMFDAFPDNPDVPEADGVSNLYESLCIAAQTGKPHAMLVQRYDVRDEDGGFAERYWQPLNTPLLDSEGRLVCLLHQVIEATPPRFGQRLGDR